MEIRIETVRTILKPLSMEDAENLFTYRSLPAVYAFHAWNPESLKDAESFIRVHSLESRCGVGDWKQLGIYARDNGRLIGDCGFYRTDIEDVEIGYTIVPARQGQGMATEVVRALANFLFAELAAQRIIAKTDPDNIASIKVLERLGFKLVSHLVNNVLIRGEWKDDLVFCLRRK